MSQVKTSKGDIETRQLTVRLPARLYSRAARVARSRQTTVNGLIRQLLDDLDRDARERELTDAYNKLGREDSAEPFFEDQAQVARRG